MSSDEKSIFDSIKMDNEHGQGGWPPDSDTLQDLMDRGLITFYDGYWITLDGEAYYEKL